MFIGIAILVTGFFVVYEVSILQKTISYGSALYGPINCVDNLCDIELFRSPYVPSSLNNTIVGQLRGATFDQITAFIKDNLSKQGIIVQSVKLDKIYANGSNATYWARVNVSESDLTKLWKLGFFPGVA